MRVLADFVLRTGSTESNSPCIGLYCNEPKQQMVLLILSTRHWSWFALPYGHVIYEFIERYTKKSPRFGPKTRLWKPWSENNSIGQFLFSLLNAIALDQLLTCKEYFANQILCFCVQTWKLSKHENWANVNIFNL